MARKQDSTHSWIADSFTSLKKYKVHILGFQSIRISRDLICFGNPRFFLALKIKDFLKRFPCLYSYLFYYNLKGSEEALSSSELVKLFKRRPPLTPLVYLERMGDWVIFCRVTYTISRRDIARKLRFLEDVESRLRSGKVKNE